MSLGGMLAGALGGGANAVGELARGQVAANQRSADRQDAQRLSIDLARETALIDEERAKRVREATLKFETDPGTIAARNRAAGEAARGAAKTTRDLQLEALNDGELTAAQAAAAERTANDATRRKVNEAEALAPVKASEAGMIAEAQGRAQARFRQQPKGEKSLSDRAAEIEAFTGVKLTPEERRRLAGLTVKGEVSDDAAVVKLTDDLIEKAVSAGSLELNDVPAKRAQLIGELTGRTARQEAMLRSAVDQARSDGKLPELQAEMQAMGMTPEQIAVYIKPKDLRAAPRRMAEAKPDATMAQMSEGTLRDIAGDRQHPRRADAQAELRRRAGPDDTSGIGYGNVLTAP
jgi:hypothetical protein